MNDKWVHFGTDWFNLSDFCHIWIETRQKIEQIKYGPLDTDYSPQVTVTGYYAMGEWRHNGEEVINCYIKTATPIKISMNFIKRTLNVVIMMLKKDVGGFLT